MNLYIPGTRLSHSFAGAFFSSARSRVCPLVTHPPPAPPYAPSNPLPLQSLSKLLTLPFATPIINAPPTGLVSSARSWRYRLHRRSPSQLRGSGCPGPIWCRTAGQFEDRVCPCSMPRASTPLLAQAPPSGSHLVPSLPFPLCIVGSPLAKGDPARRGGHTWMRYSAGLGAPTVSPTFSLRPKQRTRAGINPRRQYIPN